MSKWMVAKADLDRDQNQFLDHEVTTSGNKWINGVAGSGKSVLLMHALQDIKRKNKDASVAIIYFTHSLQQMYKIGIGELRINAFNVSFMTYIEYQQRCEKLKSGQTQFDYILCDEVQDLTAYVLELMTSNCNKLIISGDPNQSIYKRDPSSGRDVIEINKIASVTNSSEYLLTIIHRLTDSIITLIGALMPGIGALKAKKSEMKKDATVRSAKFETQSDEVKYIVDNANASIKAEQSAVILFPTHQDIENFIELYCEQHGVPNWNRVNNKWGKPNYDILNQHFIKNNANLHYIGNGYGDLWKASKSGCIILMTYHSSKGLDFDNVYLPFLTNKAQIESETLFMVALSRSKRNLLLSYSGNIHPLFNIVLDKTHSISDSIPTSSTGNGVELDLDDFDF